MEKFNSLSKGTKIALLVGVSALVLSCVFVCGVYSLFNSTRNQGVSQQNSLNAQYLDNQNELSSFISGFYEQVGIAQAAGGALDQILTDAVKGRYDKDGYGSGSPLFTAIAEAYPDVNQLMANWGKIQDYITAGREAYKAKQSKLLDMLQTYDTWRQTDFIKSTVITMLGFPTQELKARVGEMVWTGQAALDKMYQIVLTEDALKAYETGKMAPLQVPQNGKSSGQ